MTDAYGRDEPHLTLVPLAGEIVVLDVATMRPVGGHRFETPEFAADYAAAYIEIRRPRG